MLSGCGGGYALPAPTLDVVSAAAQARIASVTNFGDSITCGVGASPTNGSGNVSSLNGYAGLLDGAIAKPSQNLCRSGDQAADMTRLWVYPNAVPSLAASQLYTALIGTNDAAKCGSSAGCLSNYSQTLEASLAWLAMPASDKVLATQIVNRTGTWTTELGFGLYTNDANSSLSFPVQQVVAGRSLYVGYHVYDSATHPGTATLSIDGVQVAMLTTVPTTGQSIITQNGTSDTLFTVRVSLGPVGQHMVTVTNSAGGGFFSLLWAGASSGNYREVAGAPRVLVGGVITSTSEPLQGVVAAYNAVVTQLVGQIAGDGMYIQIVPTASALDPETDFSDFLHPNNTGHIRLANAFAGAL